MNLKKAKSLILAVAFAGIPLITTASCDPYRGSLDIYRDDDYHDSWFDVIVDDWFYDDRYYDDCGWWDDCYYDEYYYEEIVFWD